MALINYEKVFNDVAYEISDIAASKGFWDYPEIGDNGMIPLKLILVVTEITEALEEHRKAYDDDDPSHFTGMTPMQEQNFTEELADAVIRIFDIAGGYGLNLGGSIVDKIETNRNRPHLHGMKRY